MSFGEVPDLSGIQQVPVDEMVLVPVAGMDVIDGGLSHGLCTMHVRVTHVHQRRAWLIPMTPIFARKLAGQLAAMADQQETNGGEGETYHDIN